MGRLLSSYLMGYYNFQRPHSFNQGMAPAIAEEKPYLLSKITWPLQRTINDAELGGKSVLSDTERRVGFIPKIFSADCFFSLLPFHFSFI